MDAEIRVDAAVRESERALIQAKSYMIRDDNDYDVAVAMVKVFKELEKEINDAFEPIRKAAYTAYQTALSKKKKYLEPCKDAQTEIKKKMSIYQGFREKRRKEEEDRLKQEAKEKGLDDTLVVVPEKKTEGVSYRENWKYEILSFEQLPNEYKIPDDVKIGKEVRKDKDKCMIPGIRVYMTKSAVVR